MGTSPKTLRRWFKFCLMIPVPNEEPRVWLDPEVFVQPLEWISGDRFIKAVSQFKDSKAAGPDLIKPIVLKNFTEYVIDRMCNLYVLSFSL